MKNSNSNILGKNSPYNVPRSGTYTMNDVYEGKTNEGRRTVVKSTYGEDPPRWPNRESDPYYDYVRVHVREPDANNIMKDYSPSQFDKNMILDSVNRSVVPVFFGPRYQHWISLLGEQGYITLTENANQLQFGTGPFTIEFWIKRHRNDNTDHFIIGFGSGAGTSGGTGMAIYITSANRLAFLNATTAITVTGTTILPIDDWIHVACVRTDTTATGFRIYINGSLDATGICGNFHPTGSTSFYIGRDRAATQATGFWGAITDIRITTSAIYTSAFVRPTAALNMSVANIVWHDSMTNDRFYTDTGNSPNNIPVTLPASQTVKIVDGPFFNESTKTPQAHGTHSAYMWSSNRHKYFDLDPNDNSLRLGNSPYTVEAWVYMNSRAQNFGICGKGTSSNGWQLWIDSSGNLRWTSLSTELYNSVAAVTNNYIGYGGWYHVAAVRTGQGANGFRLYVNGRIEFTGTDSANYSGNDPFYVFSSRDGSSWQGTGFVCGLRISVTARYTNTFDVSSNSFIDSSMTSDVNTRFLTATCGTNKLMPTQSAYIDFGKARLPMIRRGSEIRLGPCVIGNTGNCFTNNTWPGAFLKSNNKVTTWTRLGNSTYTAFDAGVRHCAAVRSDGTLWTWGENGFGQLGLGDFISRTVPTQVGTDTNWRQVTCGYGTTLAIKTNNTLWAWGINDYNTLGDATSVRRSIPRQITTLANWSQVWIMHYWSGTHVNALKTDGTIWGWGWNGWYGIGDNTGTSQSTPVQAGNLVSSWTRLFVGPRGHQFAIRTDNTLWAWGRGENCRLGTGNTNYQAQPVRSYSGNLTVSSTFLWAAAGFDHSLCVTTDGKLWGCGYGAFGQLGQNNGSDYCNWTQIGTDSNWVKCYAGGNTSYGVKSDNSLWVWGFGYSGQHGDGLENGYWEPVRVSSLNFNHNFPLRAAENMTGLLTATGELYVSGNNKMHQLGLTLDSAFNWGTGDFSFEFWYRRTYDGDGQSGYNMLFDARCHNTDIPDGDKYTWWIQSKNNHNSIGIFVNGHMALNDPGSGTYSIQNWMHYVWQRVNGSMALYCNGRKVDECRFTANIFAFGNQVACLAGNSPWLQYSTIANGSIADIRVNKNPAAYAVNGVNPDWIQMPTSPLKPVTGTVFLTASGPIWDDYSGNVAFYNEVRPEGPSDEADYGRDRNSSYLHSHGPYYTGLIDKIDHNNITSGLIKPYGDLWDNTQYADPYSYWITPANVFPEFAWIPRMIKPWTIEFWQWGHPGTQYAGGVSAQRKLYTATSAGHNGFDIYYGVRWKGNLALPNDTINTWGSIYFRMWVGQNSNSEVFSSATVRSWRINGWNHTAVVYDPSATNKMAIFLNGIRVGVRANAMTPSTKVGSTYGLANESSGIGGIRISNSVRYSPDVPTYTMPTDGYVLDDNTIHCTNPDAVYFSYPIQSAQLSYGIIPDYARKKFGNASYRFTTLNENTVSDRIYWAENSYRHYHLDPRHRDVTMEAWCTWWDSGFNSINFDGSQGLKLPTSGTLNPTDGYIEFWIRAAASQQTNATICDSTTNNTGSYIGIQSGKLAWSIKRDTHGIITSRTTVTDNQWHHVVCVSYQQSATRRDGFMYIDGKLEAKSFGWAGGITWLLSGGQIGRSTFGTGTDANYAYTGLLANFHFGTNTGRYIGNWNKFGTTIHQNYASDTYSPFPVNYYTTSIAEYDSSARTTGFTGNISDFESGKFPLPQSFIIRLSDTVLLLNAESTALGINNDGSANNFTITAAGTLPTFSSTTPFYTAGTLETFNARPLRTIESNYGSTLWSYSGGFNVWRTEEGNWAYSYTTDYTYDKTYPKRIHTIRTTTRVRNISEGDSGWQHVCLVRANRDFILYIDGVEVGRSTGSPISSSDRPWTYDDMGVDYSTSWVRLGGHSNDGWQRAWTGNIQDFRVSMIARYETKVINGVATMCHRGTSTPALPVGLHPIGM